MGSCLPTPACLCNSFRKKHLSCLSLNAPGNSLPLDIFTWFLWSFTIFSTSSNKCIKIRGPKHCPPQGICPSTWPHLFFIALPQCGRLTQCYWKDSGLKGTQPSVNFHQLNTATLRTVTLSNEKLGRWWRNQETAKWSRRCSFSMPSPAPQRWLRALFYGQMFLKYNKFTQLKTMMTATDYN